MSSFVERYVSVAGASAHDGTVGNEWTMIEATENCGPNDRLNCIAGTYIADDSSSSSVMDLDTAGNFHQWIEWRGYTSTIGDFVPGSAPVVVINAGTNSLTNAAQTSTITAELTYNRFIGFRFTGASAHGFDSGTTNDRMSFVGCRFDTNGGRGYAGDDQIDFALCEFDGNTTNSIDMDNFCNIFACEFHNEAALTVTAGASGTLINSLFYDIANGRFFQHGSGQPYVIIGNTFDGDNNAASSAIYANGSTTQPAMIFNNIFFDLNIGVEFQSASAEEVRARGFNLFSSCNTNYESIGDETTDIDDGDVDPFTDSASRDYTPAASSTPLGAGADGALITGNTKAMDMGAIQKVPAAGGGGGVKLAGVGGGMVG